MKKKNIIPGKMQLSSTFPIKLFSGNGRQGYPPPVLDTCYYYNRSAVADLGNILEETPAEMERYTESGAETLLTNLIYRELKKGAAKND